MTLTPEDVQSKEFLTVRLREGYDMQEVDQFLDEVETELRRLFQENDQLREGIAPAEAGAETSAADVAAAREAAEEARVTDTGVLRAVSDTSDAPAAALTILTHAQTAADNLINEAQSRADALITDATATANGMVEDATRRADELDEETSRRKHELMSDLENEESSLRTRLDDLRAHEREYRSRLVAYHSEQVRHLEEGQQDETDVEAPAAVPDASDGGDSSTEDS